jgi:hypothetical protein
VHILKIPEALASHMHINWIERRTLILLATRE